MEKNAEYLNGEKTILIIDDKQINIDFLSSSLKREGFRVISSKDASNALNLAKTKLPDLILLDAHMPEKNGFEICVEFKKIDEIASIPIIFMIAKNDSKYYNQCFSSGGSDFVCKPLNIQVLVHRIKTHIELRELKEKLLPPSKRRKQQKPLSELIKMVSF
ncbi:MAG: response regulator [Candidatus Kapabacteria bacterium]|nr:response regulator [Candidatus Kapabacteria bacterium]